MNSFTEEDSEVIPYLLPVALNHSYSPSNKDFPLPQNLNVKGKDLNNVKHSTPISDNTNSSNLSFPSLLGRLRIRKSTVMKRLRKSYLRIPPPQPMKKRLKYGDRGYKERGHKKPWAEEEELLLIKLVEERGKCWQELYHYFPDRTNVDLKDKWRNIEKRKEKNTTEFVNQKL